MPSSGKKAQTKKKIKFGMIICVASVVDPGPMDAMFFQLSDDSGFVPTRGLKGGSVLWEELRKYVADPGSRYGSY